MPARLHLLATLLLLAPSSSGTHYATLGVPSDATEVAIRHAYRRAALAHHPDKARGRTRPERDAAARRMERLNEAYAILSDAAARRRYDYDRLAHAASGGHAPCGRGEYRPPARRVEVRLSATLEQLAGFAPVDIDLAAAVAIGRAGLAPRRGAGLTLRRWLPAGSAAGDVVSIPLPGVDLRVTLEAREGEGTLEERLRGRLRGRPPPFFERRGDDLRADLWLPAWHNRVPFRGGSITSLCRRRVGVSCRGATVADGEACARHFRDTACPSSPASARPPICHMRIDGPLARCARLRGSACHGGGRAARWRAAPPPPRPLPASGARSTSR